MIFSIPEVVREDILVALFNWLYMSKALEHLIVLGSTVGLVEWIQDKIFFWVSL